MQACVPHALGRFLRVALLFVVILAVRVRVVVVLLVLLHVLCRRDRPLRMHTCMRASAHFALPRRIPTQFHGPALSFPRRSANPFLYSSFISCKTSPPMVSLLRLAARAACMISTQGTMPRTHARRACFSGARVFFLLRVWVANDLEFLHELLVFLALPEDHAVVADQVLVLHASARKRTHARASAHNARNRRRPGLAVPRAAPSVRTFARECVQALRSSMRLTSLITSAAK